jgi:hypothetical protein
MLWRNSSFKFYRKGNQKWLFRWSRKFCHKNAIQAGADAYLTADLKYHQFYEAENQLLLADIGHFESERYTKNYIVEYLRKKILNFAVILSEENSNPVKYYRIWRMKELSVEDKLRAIYDLQLIDSRLTKSET